VEKGRTEDSRAAGKQSVGVQHSLGQVQPEQQRVPSLCKVLEGIPAGSGAGMAADPEPVGILDGPGVGILAAPGADILAGPGAGILVGPGAGKAVGTTFEQDGWVERRAGLRSIRVEVGLAQESGRRSSRRYGRDGKSEADGNEQLKRCSSSLYVVRR
jgi:hypothetical protein